MVGVDNGLWFVRWDCAIGGIIARFHTLLFNYHKIVSIQTAHLL